MYTILSSMEYMLLQKARKIKNMNPLIAQGINSGLGILTGAIEDQRHFNMQKKMNTEQMKNSKQMMDYQQMKSLEMWEKTGYGPQMEQMKKAGINPALMYGMSGAGAQTTGNISATGPGGQARQGGEIHGSIGMGIQAALTQAQIKNLESQAQLNTATAEKTKGVDTAESQTRIEQLQQGIDNERQRYQILKLEETLKQIENFEKQATQENRMDYIEYQTDQAMKQLELIENEAYVSSKTMDDKITIVKQEAIVAILKNEATKVGITLTTEQIKQIKANVAMGWQKVDIERFIAETNLYGVGGRIANDIISGIQRIMGDKQQGGKYMPKRKR